MKKVLAILMAGIMGIMLFSSVAVVSAGEMSEEAILKRVVEKDQAIDALTSQRVEALMEGDFSKMAEIDEELQSMGVEEITYAELCQKTKLAAPLGVQMQSQASSSDTKMVTYSNDIKHNGEWYTYMVVKVIPQNFNSKLAINQAYPVIQENRSLETGKVIVEAAANFVIGAKDKFAGIYATVFDVVCDVISVSQDTIIDNIVANYTWTALETAKFTYMPSDTINGEYIPIAACNNVTYTVTVNVPIMEFNHGVPIDDIIVKKYSGSYTPPLNSSAGLALERYIDGGGYYVNRLESFDINGIDGKKVKTVELLAPDNPSVVW